MTVEEKIRAAIKVECDRQHVGEDRQEMLYVVYSWLRPNANFGSMTEARIKNLAFAIEPDNRGQYRTTPVSFNGIVGGVAPGNIPLAMENWIEWFNTVRGCSRNDAAVETVIKEFLAIHPFSDGNGRTAWLLRVWMLNQWDDPQPLPDYFGASQK